MKFTREALRQKGFVPDGKGGLIRLTEPQWQERHARTSTSEGRPPEKPEPSGAVRVCITLPLPNKALSPNARVHWRSKANAVSEARWLAGEKARVAMAVVGTGTWTRARYTATFIFPDRRSRDLDNLMAMLKPYLDGIADAGLVENDRSLVPQEPAIQYDPELRAAGGYLRLVLEPVPEEATP